MDADLYVPGDGWLHRTDPRVKFLISIVMLALCLVWRNWAFILGILILEHVMLATDRVPAERIGWVWKILAVLIVFMRFVDRPILRNMTVFQFEHVRAISIYGTHVMADHDDGDAMPVESFHGSKES